MPGRAQLPNVDVKVEAEMAGQEFGTYPDDVQEVLMEEVLEDVVEGDAKRSRKVNLSEEYVSIQPIVQIAYSGLLANSGARNIFLHYGYSEEWKSGATIPMTKVGENKWCADVVSLSRDILHFCFVDDAGNWDNNNGQNWSIFPDKLLHH